MFLNKFAKGFYLEMEHIKKSMLTYLFVNSITPYVCTKNTKNVCLIGIIYGFIF